MTSPTTERRLRRPAAAPHPLQGIAGDGEELAFVVELPPCRVRDRARPRRVEARAGTVGERSERLAAHEHARRRGRDVAAKLGERLLLRLRLAEVVLDVDD